MACPGAKCTTIVTAIRPCFLCRTVDVHRRSRSISESSWLPDDPRNVKHPSDRAKYGWVQDLVAPRPKCCWRCIFRCASLRVINAVFVDISGHIYDALRHGLARAIFHELRFIIARRNLLESNRFPQHLTHDAGYVVV